MVHVIQLRQMSLWQYNFSLVIFHFFQRFIVKYTHSPPCSRLIPNSRRLNENETPHRECLWKFSSVLRRRRLPSLVFPCIEIPDVPFPLSHWLVLNSRSLCSSAEWSVFKQKKDFLGFFPSIIYKKSLRRVGVLLRERRSSARCNERVVKKKMLHLQSYRNKTE